MSRTTYRLTPFLFLVLSVVGCQSKAPAVDPNAVLGQRLDAALPFQQATVAARVVDLSSGKEIYVRDADRQMMPASNLKLFTTAAALDRLGRDYVFKTQLAAKGNDLYLIGDGDPAFGDPTIAAWHNQTPIEVFDPFIEAMRKARLTYIKGNLYYDDYAFDDHRTHPSWSKAFRGEWYAAPVSGLNFNDNCIDVTIDPTRPGELAGYDIVPRTEKIRINDQCRTADKHAPDIVRDPNDDFTYNLTGTCKTRTKLDSKPIQNPGYFTADAFKTYLEFRGIHVTGLILRTDGKPVTGATVLAEHQSTMPDVLKRTLKSSQNLFAEALSKQLGTNGGRARGSWAAGQDAIRAFLQKKGINASGFVAADGSGLSRNNHATPRMVCDLLLAMHPTRAPAGNDRDNAQLWHDALAEPGQQGTLRNRLQDLSGKVRCKTGSIGGVRALSGYVTKSDGKTLVFSFILNDIKGDEKQAQDKLDDAVRALAGIAK
jgi:D-alanyl-D-alanine carboxypeptidase/D-alanyl-D-alanine-endopeptidase (penicillin-binding protein 4)